jgi:hypothetical protein
MKSLLLPILLFIASALFAANDKPQTTLYLKDGNVINGTIIEQVPNVLLAIKTQQGNVLYYSASEVAKLTTSAINNHQLPALPASPPAIAPAFNYESTPQGSYVGIFEFGGLFGISEKTVDELVSNSQRVHQTYHQNFFSLQTIQGRQLANRKMYIGFGFGFDVAPVYGLNSPPPGNYIYPYDLYSASNAKTDFFVPVFMDIRGSLLKGRFSPFIEGKLGYVFYLPAPPSALSGYNYCGGPMLGLNVGFRAFITNKVAANLAFGYRPQVLITQISIPQTNAFGVPIAPRTETDEFFMHFLTLMVGISF